MKVNLYAVKKVKQVRNKPLIIVSLDKINNRALKFDLIRKFQNSGMVMRLNRAQYQEWMKLDFQCQYVG